MNEILKDVVGYEGLYVVSNQGNIYSLNYKRTGKVVKLKPGIDKDGYLQVSLFKNGEVKRRIHRLVAEAFIPNPKNLPEINHKDKNRQNNYVNNLEWCTNQYNIDYSLAKQVLQYDLSGNLINVWKSTMEIQRCLGFFHGNISKCCLGIYKTSYGFIWRYK